MTRWARSLFGGGVAISVFALLALCGILRSNSIPRLNWTPKNRDDLSTFKSLLDPASGGFILRVNVAPKPLYISVGYSDLYYYAGCPGRPCWEVLETAELEFYRQILDVSSVAIDCGGNNGFMSNFFASLGAQVYAFEMFPLTQSRWKQSALLNGMASQLHFFPHGLSNVSGEAWFGSYESQALGHSGMKDLHGSQQHNTSLRAMALQISMLDTFFVEGLLGRKRVDLLKLDVEGSEYLILEGAQHMLRTSPPPSTSS